jgi:hypothetical protein
MNNIMNMTIKNSDKFGETLDSLQQTISDSGGCIATNILFNMTVLEFLSTIASPNGIRFYHNKSYKLDKIEEEKPRKIPTGLTGNIQ